MYNSTSGNWELTDQATPGPHSTSHEDGGVDEISLAGLTGSHIIVDEVRAASAAGLKLYNDAGTAGIFVADNGYIGVNNPAPTRALDIVGFARAYRDNAQTGGQWRLEQDGTGDAVLSWLLTDTR